MEASLKDLPAELEQTKLTPAAMSPMETAEHICHVYHAIMEVAKGATFDWSLPYSSGETTLAGRIAKFNAMHAQALEVIAANPTDKVLEEALDFVSLHNAYHVGQICLLRMDKEEGWNPYSIYG